MAARSASTFQWASVVLTDSCSFAVPSARFPHAARSARSHSRACVRQRHRSVSESGGTSFPPPDPASAAAQAAL